MKADHRKELETNALADHMGRVVQGMKHTPQKRTMVWVLLVGIVLVGVWLFFRKADLDRRANSERWAMLEDGHIQVLQNLIQTNSDSVQGKAAHFELNFVFLRHLVKSLASNPKDALDNLANLEKGYRELALQCKDDKVLLPEALFAAAVIQETRIIKDDANWKVALEAYKEVADNHKDSAFGKVAQQRVNVLNDKDKREDLLKTYQDLRFEFLREDRFPFAPQDLPKDHPPILDVPGIPKP